MLHANFGLGRFGSEFRIRLENQVTQVIGSLWLAYFHRLTDPSAGLVGDTQIGGRLTQVLQEDHCTGNVQLVFRLD